MNCSMDEIEKLKLPTKEEEEKYYDSFKRGRFTIVVKKESNNLYTIKGKNIVFTGKGPYSRGVLMKMAREYGAFASSNSISKHTDALVVGNKPGSKVIKAKRDNIRIISMDDFLAEVE